MVRAYYDKLFTRLVLIGILLAGFGLRASYMRGVHPFEDEFISMLASQAAQHSFLPILPSGLFYIQGLSYSIVNALFVGLMQIAGNGSLPEALQVPYRLPSVFIGVLSMALIYRVGREWFSSLTGLIAAGLLAVSPLGIIWDARVRMYGLAMCLTVALLFALSKMAESPRDRRWRVIALIIFIAAFLNHALTILLLPPLVMIAILWAWQAKLLTRRLFRPEGMKTLAVWGLAILAALVGSGLILFAWIYAEHGGSTTRFGSSAGGLVARLMHFSFSWDNANKFLDGLIWSNSFNLYVFAVALGGGLLLLLLWIIPPWRKVIGIRQRRGILALFILSTGPLVEFLVFMIQYSRNDRYWTPFLPVVLLLAALVVEVAVKYLAKLTSIQFLEVKEHWAYSLLALAAIAALGGAVKSGIVEAFNEALPAYEQALYFVKHRWQPGDVIVIPFPSASGVYLGRTDYLAADVEGEIKVLDTSGDTSVDRFWGAPWIQRGRQFQDVLQKHTRVWFVVDQGHYRGLFRADWHFVEQHSMKLAWAKDRALVYVSGKAGIPLPDKPEHELNANLSDVVSLQGYTSAITGLAYRVFLFWKVQSSPPYDFIQFVHIRDQAGKTVAQADFQPLKGEYPTRYWRPGEVVDIPIPAGIAAGEYRVLAGLYRWDTLERLPVTGDTTGENAVELERVQVGGQAAK